MVTLQTIETTQKRVKLSTGITLPYVEQGDPAGVPVILLHGITDSWYSFEPVLRHLPASVHAFALSQRGHGDAERPATGYQMQDFAADVAAFADALGLGRVVVAGHSMGSTIAQRFALDFPSRTLGLVLVSACPTFRDNPELVELWDGAVSTFDDPLDPTFVQAFQESTLARPVPPDFLEMVVRESLKAPARVWRAALQGLLESDFSSELSNIKTPTLLVWGDQDGMVLRQQQKTLVDTIKGSRLVIYPGVGHAAHWEEPARFAADLTAFVKTITR